MNKNNSLINEDLDEIIKEHVESLYPIDVIIDKENSRGLFKFNSSFPPFQGTVIKFGSAYFDEMSNNLSFAFDIIENPKNISRENRDLLSILFNVISFIFKLECEKLLQKK
jgi:hypothetical protein